MQADVTIDGQRVDPGTVAFDRFNFGRQGDRPVARHQFVLVAEQGPFLERFTPLFERIMTELRDDDARNGFEPLYDGAERLPTLDEMFALPHSARMQVMAQFSFDILGMYLDGPEDRRQWVGMSIDDVRLEGGQLTIVGTARRPARGPSWVERTLTRLKLWTTA